MGIYLNPIENMKDPKSLDGSFKLAFFVRRFGSRMVDKESFQSFIPGSKYNFECSFGVAVVENGPFDAAAVAFNEREVQDFTNSNEKRPVTYFILSLEQINKLEPDIAKQLKQFVKKG